MQLQLATTTCHLLELAKVQIKGEKGNGQSDAHAGQCCNSVECEWSNRCHTQLEDTLGNRHLATVPLHRPASGAAKVERICGWIIQSNRLQHATLDLIKGRGAHSIRAAERDRTLRATINNEISFYRIYSTTRKYILPFSFNYFELISFKLINLFHLFRNKLFCASEKLFDN